MWRLKLNLSKTEFIILNRGAGSAARNATKRASECVLKVDGVSINQSAKVVYLGVTFTPNLNFNSHILSRLLKANTAMGKLAGVFKKKNLSINVKSLLYSQLVRPVFTYAFPIWCNSHKTYLNKLFLFERKCLRKITGLHRDLSHPDLHYFKSKYVFANSKVKKDLTEFFQDMSIKIYCKLQLAENSLISELLEFHPDVTLRKFTNPLEFLQSPDNDSVIHQALIHNSLSSYE